MYRGEVSGEFIQILQFFYQSAFILKGKHCLLSRHDHFDYNSTDFSQILEKKSGVTVGG